MSKQRFSFDSVLECVRDVVVVTEAAPVEPPGPRIVYTNHAFERVTGYDRDEVLGRSPRFLQGPRTSPEVRSTVRRALVAQRPIRATLINYTKSGSPYWVELSIEPLRDDAGEVSHFVCVQRDLTDQKRVQEELYRLASTDALTGIGNRRAFFERAAIEVDKARRYHRPLSLLIFDIDHFKRLNDTHGHEGGDQVLKAVARRAVELLRNVDVLGRIGGEEFAVALPETSAPQAEEVANRLRVELSTRAYCLAGTDVGVTASFGVATLGPQHVSLDALIREADLELYRAKESGRNCVCSTRSLITRDESAPARQGG